MNLNDLLRSKDFDPKQVLVLRHRPHEPELNKVLPWLAAEKPDVFNAYQQTQGPRLEGVMDKMVGEGYVASFIGHEPGKALFIGLYSVDSSKPMTREEYWQVPAYIEMKAFGMQGFSEEDSRTSCLWFELGLTDFYEAWKGRLIVEWPPPERSWWRRAHRNVMPVHAILEDSVLDASMPGWNEVVLTWEELGVLPTRWKSALSQWRAIYLIYDESNGKGYVGSAYGETNLLGRWLSYASRGHGGDRLLRARDPRNFRFSILQRVSPDMEAREVIRLEESWKDRLHTRAPRGFNHATQRSTVTTDKSGKKGARAVSNRFLVLFSPENWTPAKRFRSFMGPPFPESSRLSRSISAAESRRQKLVLLSGLANHLRDGLLKDLEELESMGVTSARRSKHFTAIIETIFLELYSLLDAVRSTLFEVYRDVRGVQNQSTHKLFRRAHENTYGPEFPLSIRTRLASAFGDWFPELRDIRTELSHGDVGQCHLDPKTRLVTYMHGGLGTPQRTLVIKDVEARLTGLYVHVTELVDSVFGYLCEQLQPRPVRITCGIFRGRLYERTAEYDPALSFDSGTCFSRRWFESEEHLLCPMRSQCGAYPG